MFNYLKTGFSNLDDDEIFKLENFALKWGIKGNKWTKQEGWNFGKITEENKKEIQEMNMLKEKIVKPLLKFKKEYQSQKDVEGMTKALYSFLIENEIDKKLENKIKQLEEENQLELAQEYSSSWQIIMNVLDEIVLIFKDEKITFDKYEKLLKIGLASSGLGKIPASNDVVILGDIDRSRSHKVRAIFIIGLNDGVMPSVNKNEGFLNDKDRENLKKEGIELAKGTLEKLYEDNFNIYKAFTTSEEKLYLSYASSDNEGKALRGSVLVPKIKKLFPKLEEESDIIENVQEITTKETTFDEMLLTLRNFKDGETIDPKWIAVYEYYKQDEEFKEKLENSLKALNYTNLPETLSKENVEKLYGLTMNTSISKLEKYRSCPFSFYLEYGLKLTEKNTFKLQSIDTGTFMHEVIDEFFNIARERKINIKEIEEEQINKIIEEIIHEKLKLNKNYIFTSIPKYRVLTMRLKKVIKQSMKYIIESLKESDFEVWGNEIEFKRGGTYPPIKLELEDGKKVEIIGKIDRVDLAKNENGKYLRIIDYKSSVKNIDLNEVIAGLQIQLLTYLDAVTKIEKCLPAGVLYFNLIDPVIKTNKGVDKEKIAEELKKQFKMKGLILADVKVVKMMDKNLKTGVSKLIPAYIDRTENLSPKFSNAVSKENFEKLQNCTYKILKDISREILSGKIDLKPYYKTKSKKTPCEYCKYKPICGFNPGFAGNDYNYILNKPKEEILGSLGDGSKVTRH